MIDEGPFRNIVGIGFPQACKPGLHPLYLQNNEDVFFTDEDGTYDSGEQIIRNPGAGCVTVTNYGCSALVEWFQITIIVPKYLTWPLCVSGGTSEAIIHDDYWPTEPTVDWYWPTPGNCAEGVFYDVNELPTEYWQLIEWRWLRGATAAKCTDGWEPPV